MLINDNDKQNIDYNNLNIGGENKISNVPQNTVIAHAFQDVTVLFCVIDSFSRICGDTVIPG